MKRIKLLFLRVLISKTPSLLINLAKIISVILNNKKIKRCFLLCTDGTNEDYFNNGVLTAINSLKLTNPGIPIVVYYSQLSPSQKAKLKGCKLIEITEKSYDARHRPDLTDATFYRLHLDRLEEFDKVIYIDSDMVVLDSLDEIFQLPGNLIAVGQTKNYANEFRDYQEIFEAEGIKNPILPGFNAGFLCFNQNYWKDKLLKEVVSMGEKYGWDKFINLDQGLLHLVVYRRGGFTSVPHHYNFRAWGECLKVERNSKGFLAPYVDGNFVKVIHFSGPFKPWHYETKYNSYPKLQKFMDMYFPCYEQFIKV
jgi:lipopolysaccharide biosynthesis glycosyltransferase